MKVISRFLNEKCIVYLGNYSYSLATHRSSTIWFSPNFRDNKTISESFFDYSWIIGNLFFFFFCFVSVINSLHYSYNILFIFRYFQKHFDFLSYFHIQRIKTLRLKEIKIILAKRQITRGPWATSLTWENSSN